MTLRAEGFRHLKTLRQNKERPWEWTALVSGRAQPNQFALSHGPWRRRSFRFHLTPIHIERWSGTWEIGVCLGQRTICLMIHR